MTTTASREEDGKSPAPAEGRQSIYIARYGLPETPLVEGVGPFDMNLSAEGTQAAHELARHLHENARIKHIFTSPFKRALHTASIVSQDLGLGKVNVEDGITEWQSPELVGGENPYKPPSLIDLLENFPEINPKWEPMCRPEPFETEEEMCTRAARVARILADSCFPSDVLIVSHAPCNIAIGLGLEGLDLKEARGRTKIEPWPLGGLTRFTRDSVGESSRWELTESCATGHLSGQWREGKQRWTLPALRRHVQARGW